MAQLSVKTAFNQHIEEFVRTKIFPPIIAYMAQKGMSCTIPELSNVLELSETSVGVSNGNGAHNPRSNPIPIGMVGQNGETKVATTVKTVKKRGATTTETCLHILTKSKSRSGNECGRPAHAFARCKACLKKRIVIDALSREGITSQQIDQALGNSAVASTGQVGPNTVISNMNSNEFTEINGYTDIFLHNPSKIIVKKEGQKYIAMGVSAGESAQILTPENIETARKLGFEVQVDDSTSTSQAQTPPPPPTPVIQTPVPIAIPTSPTSSPLLVPPPPSLIVHQPLIPAPSSQLIM